MASAAEPSTLDQASRNPDGAYDGAKALAWLSQALAGDRGLSEAEILAAFETAKAKARSAPAPAGPVLRITSKVEGFRRAGLSHAKAAADHPLDRFDAAQLAALAAEPTLTVIRVDPDGTEHPLATSGLNASDAEISPAA